MDAVKRYRLRRKYRLDARRFDNQMTRLYRIAIDEGIPNASDMEPTEFKPEIGYDYYLKLLRGDIEYETRQ